MNAEIGQLGGRDPHDVLGVPRGAGPQQVTRAFHRRALEGGHPDTGGDERAFRRLVAARDVLLDAPASPGVHAATPPGAHAATPPGAPAADDDIPSRSTAYDTAPRPASGSGTSMLPLVLIFLYLVGIPIVARVIMLLAVR